MRHLSAFIFLICVVPSVCFSQDGEETTYPDNYLDSDGNPKTCNLVLDPHATRWDATRCPDNHVTTHGSIPYDHVHCQTLSSPAEMIDSNLNVTFLPLSAIDAYYDKKMGFPTDPNVSKSGGIDTSINCYGYCFGICTYVDGYSTITGADYDEVLFSDYAAGDVGINSAHGYKVEAVVSAGSGNAKNISKTSEKFRASAVYTITYNPAFSPNSTIYRKKP